jgi:SPP1 gp7 family putative phage head morphogenesis protein
VPVTDKTVRLQQQIRDDLGKITDAQTRELVRAWAEAWDEVAPDLTATLVEMLTAGDRVTRAQLLRSARLRKVLGIIATQLQELAQASKVRLTGDLAEVIDLAGGAQASVIDSQLPPSAPQLVDMEAWSRVDERQIKAIVTRSTQQITALHRPLSPEAYSAVRRELIRGVASGSNPRATAARMVARARSGFNGGLTRALTIARTEMLDAHRAAAALGQGQHADVLKGWTWGASMSGRTCPACLAMNGSEWALSDPGPEGHQNCRCTRIPLVKSYADLGITGVEEPASLLPDAEKYFSGLSKGDQVGILGQRGYDAWAAGEFPMSSWATKRSTPGWRDSYVPAKPPSLKGGRVAA